MKNAAGTSFDCAACVSVSQISARERWTTGLGTGGSGGGVFAKSAGWLSGVATPPSSENIESSAASRGLSFSRVLSSLSLGAASADFSLTIEALEKSVSESFGLEPSELDSVARHRQAGTNKCRIVVWAPEISAALELASEQVGLRKRKPLRSFRLCSPIATDLGRQKFHLARGTQAPVRRWLQDSIRLK